MILKRRLTVDEYLALPESKPYLEYIQGRAVPKPVPDKNHMRIAGLVDYYLVGYAREHGGFAGPEGRSEFPDRHDHRFLLPDSSYFAPDRAAQPGPELPAPTLAVEVRSKDQSIRELREKCAYYMDHGVQTAWLIDPQNGRAEVFLPGQAAVVVMPSGSLTSPALPGFEIPLAELFAALG